MLCTQVYHLCVMTVRNHSLFCSDQVDGLLIRVDTASQSWHLFLPSALRRCLSVILFIINVCIMYFCVIKLYGPYIYFLMSDTILFLSIMNFHLMCTDPYLLLSLVPRLFLLRNINVTYDRRESLVYIGT